MQQKPYQFEKSRQLFERATNSIAGGVSSGIRKLEQPVPLYFEQGQGSRLWDVDGNVYLDYAAGQGALLLGHADPGWVAVVTAQAGLGSHFAAQTELEIRLAEWLCRYVPSIELCRFSSTASEAVLTAFRLARAATGRSKILKFEGHYHGWTDEGMISFSPPLESSGPAEAPRPQHSSQGVLPGVIDQFVIARWNDPAHLEAVVALHHRELAAIMCEPILCNTGCIEPVPGMLETIRQLCDRYGLLFICDETITGFRLGPGGAQTYYNVRPDLTTFGKALGSGVPISAIGGRRDLLKLITEGKVTHAGTFNGNPLCLTAATYTTEKVAAAFEADPSRLFRLGQHLMLRLKELADKFAIPLVLSGPGPVFHAAILKEAGPVQEYRHYVQRVDGPRWAHLRLKLLEYGVRPIERGLWYIGLAHQQADLDETLTRAEFAFAAHCTQWPG